jgi:hypothetical protein
VARCSSSRASERWTAPRARPAPPQSDYQHLVDALADWRKKLFQLTVAHQAEGGPAGPPDLTDWQEEYLEGIRRPGGHSRSLAAAFA